MTALDILLQLTHFCGQLSSLSGLSFTSQFESVCFQTGQCQLFSHKYEVSQAGEKCFKNSNSKYGIPWNYVLVILVLLIDVHFQFCIDYAY
jgi:hypothetical protein